MTKCRPSTARSSISRHVIQGLEQLSDRCRRRDRVGGSHSGRLHALSNRNRGRRIQRRAGGGCAAQLKPYIHPTALIEDGVEIGADTSVWDNVHIRRNTRIGHHCIVGEKTHISYDVQHRKYGKDQCVRVYLHGRDDRRWRDGRAGCIFTNDRYPRATEPDVTACASAPG